MNIRTPHADPEARKQRLQREALLNADFLLPSAESIGKVFGAVGLALMAAAALSGSLPVSGERVTTRAADPNFALARQSLPVTRSEGESARTEPEGNVQDLTY